MAHKDEPVYSNARASKLLTVGMQVRLEGALCFVVFAVHGCGEGRESDPAHQDNDRLCTGDATAGAVLGAIPPSGKGEKCWMARGRASR